MNRPYPVVYPTENPAGGDRFEQGYACLPGLTHGHEI
jgi:hypothetical protein